MVSCGEVVTEGEQRKDDHVEEQPKKGDSDVPDAEEGKGDDVEEQPDVGNNDDPPSPKLRKINRRSSIAMARRMSRASAASGLSLEDQLETVAGPDEASNVDRFKQILNLCVRSTCRFIERAETEDGDLEDEARTVSMHLMDGCILDEDKLNTITERLVQSNLEVKPEDLLSSKVRAVREYTSKLEEEAAQWKKTLRERQQLYKQGEANYKSVVKGDIKVDASQVFCLSADDKKFFRNLPNLTAAMESVRKSEERQCMLAVRMASEARQLKRKLETVDEELKNTAKELMMKASEAQGIQQVEDIDKLLEVDLNSSSSP